jgi:hypothetical protein
LAYKGLHLSSSGQSFSEKDITIDANQGSEYHIPVKEGQAQDLYSPELVIAHGLVVDPERFGDLAIGQSFEVGHFEDIAAASG